MPGSVSISPADIADRQRIDTMMAEYRKELARYSRRQPISGGHRHYLGGFWKSRRHFPYLVLQAQEEGEGKGEPGAVAGFALVLSDHDSLDDEFFSELADFYIRPEFRRQGVGMQAAHLVWDRYPGHWWLDLIGKNFPARRFWRHCLETAGVDHQERATGTGGIEIDFNWKPGRQSPG